MSQTVTAIELTTSRPDGKDELGQHTGDHPTALPNLALRKGPTAVIFTSVTAVTGVSSLLAGLVTVALPRIVHDLEIPQSLLLWPASIYALTCGCSLILAGAIADVVGSRFMYILGCLLQSAFTLACGLARDPFQLILFRGLAGIAIAFCLPSAVSLITTYFPHGKRRNMAFAAMGGGQPVGFSIGLTVGGVLVDSSAGWRAGFYVAAGINTIALILSIWGLPRITREEPLSWDRLLKEIDWTGALLLSASLGMLSYVFAALTGAVTSIKRPATITLLVTAVVMMTAFIVWVARQERVGKPAIIPNSLWRNKVFTSICLDVFLLWGAFNATETLLTFFFQEVQMLNATNTSIRFLPAPIVGVAVNLLMGLIIHRIRANWAIILATLISCISPILTAVMKPSDSYWEFVFPSIALNALGPDVLFTASNLIITDAFPDKTQALAGGVFNTVAQIGKSVGLALSAVIASTVSANASHSKSEQLVLLEGYQAAWWFILGITALTIVISAVGLRGIGRLGLKRE